MLREGHPEFIKDAVESMLDCFGIYSSIRDSSGKIIDFRVEYVNKAACENNLMSKEQQMGKKLLEILPAHKDTGLFNEYCRVVETGESLVKEAVFYEDNYGDKFLSRAFDIRISKLNDGFVATWRDVSQNKRGQKALKESEKYFRHMADNSPVLIWTSGIDKHCNFFNSIWLNFTGRSLEQELGYGWLEGVHPDDRDYCIKTYSDCFDKRKRFCMEYRLRHHSGEYRYIIDIGTPFFSEEGEFKGYIGSGIDIDEQKAFQKHKKLLIKKSMKDRIKIDTLMEELRSTNNTLGTLLDILPVGVIVSDKDGRIIKSNKSLKNLLVSGIAGNVYRSKARYCTYKPNKGLFPSNDLPLIRSLHKGEYIKDKEMWIKTGNGNGCFISASSSPIINKDGEIIGAVAVLTDITGYKRVTQELKEKQEFLTVLLNAITESILLVNTNGTILALNDTAAQRFKGINLDTKEFIGKNAFEFVDLEARITRTKQLEEVVKSQKPVRFVDQRDGMWLDQIVYPILDQNYNVTRIAIFGQDITEKIKAEEKFKESEARFKNAFSNAAIGMAVVSLDGRFTEVNQSLCSITGYCQQELTSKTFIDIIHPEDLDKYIKYTHKLMEGKIGYYNLEKRYLHKLGHTIWVLVSVSLIHDSKGNPAGFLTQIQDLALKTSMDEAAQFQKRLIPEFFPECSSIKISARYLPSKKVGGDLYCVYKVDNHLVVVILDVCGNGMKAAMASTYLKASLDYIVNIDKIINPDEIMNRILRMLSNGTNQLIEFLTVFISSIDIGTQNMECCNFRHCPTVVSRKGTLTFLDNMPCMNISNHSGKMFKSCRIQLEPGDTLLFYTDGLYEWRNNNEFFGINNLKRYLYHNDLSENSINRLVQRAAENHINTDDIAYLILKIGSKKEYEVYSDNNSFKLLVNWCIHEIDDKIKDRHTSARIKQCVDELIANAFKHGNKFDISKKIYVRIHYFNDIMKFCIKDQGNGFDWRSVLNGQTLKGNLLGGRGIYIVKYFADDVQYNEMGNEVNVRFFIGGNGYVI